MWDGEEHVWITNGSRGGRWAKSSSLPVIEQQSRRWIEHLQNRIAYEKAMLGEVGGIAAAQFNIEVGGRVLVADEWVVVLKLNRAGGTLNSVSTTPLRHWHGSSTKVEIERVKDYRAPEAERARREKLHKARISKFDRILEKAPAMFSAAQLRVFLRALATIDPYAFDDVAEQLAANDENNEQTSEEILLSTIDGLPDDKLTGFTLRLVLTAHTAIPRESEIDFLAEAEAALAPSEPKKTANKKAKTPTPIKTAQKTTAAKKTKAKKQAAA
jgi:hypothetical protein